MKSPLFVFSVLAIAISGLVSCATPGAAPSAGPSPAAGPNLQDPPAKAIRQIVNGKIVVDRAEGLRALDQSMRVTSNDKWHLGSVTKTMTSYLIAMLIDEKKLALDDKLSKTLKNYFDPMSPVRDIRLRDLLSHRSGLADIGDISSNKAWTDGFTSKAPMRQQRERFVRAILLASPKFAPDEKFAYANSNYIVLGEIIERIEKKPWEQVIEARLFKPLGMKGCGFGPQAKRDRSPPDQPWGHAEIGGKLVPIQPKTEWKRPADNPPLLGPAGTVHCDFDSWAAFLKEMLAAAKGQSKLLRPETAKYFFSEGKEQIAGGGWGIQQAEWAQGPVYSMVGSNTMNYAIFNLAPNRDMILMGAANSGTDHTLEVLRSEFKELTKANEAK